MAIITVGDISYLPYAGHEDPGLPNRVWAVMLTATGDGSGGTNTGQVNLKSAAVSPGNIFSLEQLSVLNDDQTDLALQISASGFQSFGPDFLRQIWIEPLLANEVDQETGLSLISSRPRLWLGRGASAGPAATLSFRSVNTNTFKISIYALGYMWTTGATNVPGGPRRPMSGVFSN